jgi:diacylglycerol kinase family enzyme
VRAAAIAHTYLKERVVEPFHDARVNVFRGNMLEPGDLPDVAMVFGGDGAVHRLLASLAHSRTPLLVVPTGSANDFAECLGIHSPADALRAWRRYLDLGDNVRSIDLATVRPLADEGRRAGPQVTTSTYAGPDGRIEAPRSPLASLILRQARHHAEESAERQRTIYFSGIAAVGLAAEANRRANRMPGWLRGHGGYTLAALQALASYAPPMLSVCSYDVDGEETRLVGEVLTAAIGNAPQYGGGMRMLPLAEMDDGQLDVCFVPSVPRGRVLRNFSRVFAGSHLALPEVHYLRSCQLFLESDEPLEIYGDGEYLCRTPAEIAVAPRALRVILP